MTAAEIALVCLSAAGIGLVCALMKNIRSEFAMLAAVSAGISLLVIAASWLAPVFQYVNTLCESSGYGEYMQLLIKAIGLGIIGCSCSEICRDVGEGALAMKLDLAIKAAILLISLPLLKNLFGLLEEFTA